MFAAHTYEPTAGAIRDGLASTAPGSPRGAVAEAFKSDLTSASEALLYANAGFYGLVKVSGAMFAPQPQLVTVELARVCRPGGRVAMANWTSANYISQLFKITSQHASPPSMPSPLL
jgi:hypothetical protein